MKKHRYLEFFCLEPVLLFIIPLYVLFFLFSTDAAIAQLNQGHSDLPNVYIDSRGWGFFESYIRTNIEFVNYVRDQDDADIYLRMTWASTGTGRQYTLDFRGIEPFSSRRETIIYNSSDLDSQDKRRRGLVNHISIGLIPFVSNTDPQ